MCHPVNSVPQHLPSPHCKAAEEEVAERQGVFGLALQDALESPAGGEDVILGKGHPSLDMIALPDENKAIAQYDLRQNSG